MEDEIIESYEALDVDNYESQKNSNAALDILRKSSSEGIFVAVRSSATTEDLADASFAGQQDSFVNVKGPANLIKHIKKMFCVAVHSKSSLLQEQKRILTQRIKTRSSCPKNG